MDTLKLFKTLSSETNLQILSLLRSGSFHPRELARLLQRSESDVSRRLRKLEKLGLVEGKWVRLGDKNVRVYSLKVDEVKINFLPGEVQVGLEEREAYTVPIALGDAPDVEFFVGRKKEIETLRNSKGNLVVVYGIAGIGKTSLLAKAFPEAFWYTMDGSESFEYLAWQLGLHFNSLGYTHLIEYLRSGGKGEREIFELILEGLEKTESVVIIDDFHKCQDDAVNRLLTYLAGKLRKGTVAVASRIKPMLGIEGVVYISLGGLKPREAYELAKNVRGEVSVEGFAEIYRVTRGHPLAIILLLESPELSEEVVRENFFEFLFMEIYQSLSADERRMLSILSLFEGSLEYDAIKTLYGKKNAFPVLHSLLRRGLVERRGRNYFVHDMLKGFVNELREISEEDCYSKYIEYLLKKETLKDFLTAFKYAVKIGRNEKIRHLIELRVRKFKRVVQDFPDAYMKLLLQIKENPYAKKELGHVYFHKGFLEKALKLWLEVEDDIGGIHRADAISSLVDVYIELNSLEEAKKYLKELKSIAEKSGDLEIKFWYYVELTKLYFYMGKPEDALRSAFEELKIVRRMELYPEIESAVLLHIGDIYVEMEKEEEALKYYLQALNIAEAYSLAFMENLAKMELTKIYFLLKDYERAVKYGKEATEYFIRVRNYRRATDVLSYRCLTYIALGKIDEAKKDAEEIIRIAQSTNYPLGWAGYIFIGVVKMLKGEGGREYIEEGRKHLEKYPWLYDAVLQELERVFDTSLLGKPGAAPQAN